LIFVMDWKAIDTAPFDRDVELAVIDAAGVHALAFPCRRVFGGWVNAQTRKRLYYLLPTHWRDQSAVPMSDVREPISSAGDEAVKAGPETLTRRLAAIHRASSRANDL
jgi:hypothetical protein